MFTVLGILNINFQNQVPWSFINMWLVLKNGSNYYVAAKQSNSLVDLYYVKIYSVREVKTYYSYSGLWVWMYCKYFLRIENETCWESRIRE